ncbi:MAG: asparagine synthase-related protein [bacterium]
MSHFALTYDANPARRKQFLAAIRQTFAHLSGATVRVAETGSLAVAWTHWENTPWNCTDHPESFGLLLGYALTDADEQLDARRLLAAWCAQGGELGAFDGYFLGIASAPSGALSVMCDPLGLFPVYYTQKGDVLVAGSSPACCIAHPACPNVLDPLGLAGILLTHGLVEGRTLVDGVARLSMGHRLEWQPEGGVCEREIFRLQPEETWRDTSNEEILVRAAAMMRHSIRRHLPRAAETSLLLSGGLDSRLMAAVLSAEGVAYTPFTWGRRDDFEVRAARAVAEALRLTLTVDADDPSLEAAVALARQTAQGYAVPGGFGGMEAASGGDSKLARAAPYFWSGIIFDYTWGGLAARLFLLPTKPGERAVDAHFTSVNTWGIAPGVLARLLHPILPESAVEALICKWKASRDLPGLTSEQKGYMASLNGRTRFHLGDVLHRLSVHSWPLLPWIERQQLQFVFNLDARHVQNRQLEMELLLRVNPRLAAIPFDTNSFRFGASLAKKAKFQASWSRKLKDRLLGHVRRWYWQYIRRSDPRRYYRLFDLNAPPWRAVRAAAEPNRSRAAGILDPHVLAELLPPAGVPIRHNKPFAAGASLRNLIGVLFWLEQPPR